MRQAVFLLRDMAALLALSCCGPGMAQGFDLTYRGYGEVVIDGYQVNRAAAVNPDNVLGLPSSNAAAVADFVVSARQGPFKAVYEGYGLASQRGSGQPIKAYQQYVSMTSKDQNWFFRVGTVVPSWGVGQIWNPVRSLTNEGRRDLVSPSRAVEGVRLAQAQWIPDVQSSVSVLVLPGEAGRARGYALRYSSALGALDYALSVYGNERSSRRAGVELSWILGMATFVGEATWSNRSDARYVASGGTQITRGDDAAVSYVLGTSVALPGERQLVLEFFHDADGFSRPEFDAFARALPASFGLYKPLGNGRDTLYAGLTQSILQNNSSIGISLFNNVQSEVSLMRFSAETQVAENVRLLFNVGRYREPCCRASVNIYRTTLDARLRWNF